MNDAAIKDVRNPFRLKKKSIKNRVNADITNIFLDWKKKKKWNN